MVDKHFLYIVFLYVNSNCKCNSALLQHTQKLHKEWRRGIVVMDFDCYTGDRGSIPTHEIG